QAGTASRLEPPGRCHAGRQKTVAARSSSKRRRRKPVVSPLAGSARGMPLVVLAGCEDSLLKPPGFRQELGTSSFRPPPIIEQCHPVETYGGSAACKPVLCPPTTGGLLCCLRCRVITQGDLRSSRWRGQAPSPQQPRVCRLILGHPSSIAGTLM